MSSATHEAEVVESPQKATAVKQETAGDNSFIEGLSFDRTALVLFAVALLVESGLIWYFEIIGILPTVVAIVASVFTLQSLRENKRDREASVAPTLFVGTEGGEYGVLNLGNGPAHELTLRTADGQPVNWEDVGPELEGEVLQVDDFLCLGTGKAPQYVRMEYRSNMGYKEYNVTRGVLPYGD